MSDTPKLHPIRMAVYIIALLGAISAVVGGYAVSSYRLDAAEEDVIIIDKRVDKLEIEMVKQSVMLGHIKENTDLLLAR